ncbi:hypothetical protein Q8G37_15820 [Bacillus wiedmannii]|uniref:hypothetical protein n=1 Tax=Bacillus wiedmannii TaxID=1890302 RepID=UPI0027308F60|nr:hypothetical protein [Bacillus wiedmannii]MDP1457914.1 hypothetical protein [Bacillus wiedmannii]
MKKYIIAVLMSLPTWFWLGYFCGLSNVELLATAFILGVTFGIYEAVLEETDKDQI